jgi:hypothetical protein
MTKDGTPRIAINWNLIKEETFNKLKYTLLHEFVHAHEVPGFKPLGSWANSDLSYLPEYNHMMDTLNLNSEGEWINYVLWGLAVVGLYAGTHLFIRTIMGV